MVKRFLAVIELIPQQYKAIQSNAQVLTILKQC